MSRRPPVHPLFPLLLIPLIFLAAFFSSAYEGMWVGSVAKVVLYLGVAGAAGYSVFVLRAEKELERLILLEAGAVAFLAVLATAFVFASLDEFDVISSPSPWTFWNTGCVAFVAARFFLLWRRT